MPGGDWYVSSIFGSSPSDIWGITFNGLNHGLRHFDGRGWTSVASPSPQGYFYTGFARAPNDAIAVDTYQRHWHWDGTSW